MHNRYPLWKYLLILALLVFGVIYALPNLYADQPALQISTTSHNVEVNEALISKVTEALQKAQLKATSEEHTTSNLLLTFTNTDQQAAAQEIVKAALGEDAPYVVALYLKPTTPMWLSALGAKPMRLGLDLRGGVHLLLAVDVDAVFNQLAAADLKSVALGLRGQHIRYSGLLPIHIENGQGLLLQFRETSARDDAYRYVTKEYPSYQWNVRDVDGHFVLEGVVGQAQSQEIRQNTIDQSMTILRNRVNELGISEAVVTQQGADQIAIDLPGIQDPAQAQNILGKTATVELRLVDTANSAEQAAVTGVIPPDDDLVFNDHHQAFLLKKEVVLQGASITNATANYGDQGAEVSIRLSGGAAVSRFNQITAENIGKLLGTLYVESRPIEHKENGKSVTTYKIEKKVINAATINSALGNSFRITGISDIQEASQLALLLRAGALPVPIHIIQQRTIGPSLGQQNIDKGLLSVELGFGAVVLFMILYYRVFGLIANVALGMNLLLIVAMMSILGSVLTLPGIAGMVLTVGMAVDANVLIFERIREELRMGITPQAAIFTGYERALITIVDANVTTLIVAIVLFSLGSGAVKGFAITLTIGLITSMITAILGTRAMVNGLYGWRNVKKLPIGIKITNIRKAVVYHEAANS